MKTISDKPFVPYQFYLVSILKFEDTFPGLCYNEFLNSLYVTLGTLEFVFHCLEFLVLMKFLKFN